MILIGIATFGVGACTSAQAKREPVAARPTTAHPATATTPASLVSINTASDMVTTGKIVSVAKDLLQTVSALRTEISQRGGVIDREDVQYTQTLRPSAWSDYAKPADRNYAEFTVKVPSHEAAAFLQWLLRQGTIVHQEIDAVRVPDQASSPQPSLDGTEAEAPAPPWLHLRWCSSKNPRITTSTTRASRRGCARLVC